MRWRSELGMLLLLAAAVPAAAAADCVHRRSACVYGSCGPAAPRIAPTHAPSYGEYESTQPRIEYRGPGEVRSEGSGARPAPMFGGSGSR